MGTHTYALTHSHTSSPPIADSSLPVLCVPFFSICNISLLHVDSSIATIVKTWKCHDEEITTPASVIAYEAALLMKVIQIIVGCFGLVPNVLVFIVIVAYRPLRYQYTGIFVANLAAIDAFVSLFLIITTVSEYDATKVMLPGRLGDQLLCYLWYSEPFLWGLLTSSAYGTVALGFEAYLCIVHPVLHRTAFTRCKVVTIILLTWLIGLVYNFLQLTLTAEITQNCVCSVLTKWPHQVGVKPFVGVLSMFVEFLIPCGLLLYFYGRLAITLSRGLNGDFEMAPIIHTRAGLQRARSDVFDTMALVAVFFVLCWSCSQVYYLLYFFGFNNDFTGIPYNLSVVANYLNSCVNPIIYGIKYRQFQQGLQWLVLRLRQLVKSKTSEDNDLQTWE